MEKCYVAITHDGKYLDNCHAMNENEALWKFAQMNIYPRWAVELPSGFNGLGRWLL